MLRNESVRFAFVLPCFVLNKMNVFLHGFYNNFADLFGQILKGHIFKTKYVRNKKVNINKVKT